MAMVQSSSKAKPMARKARRTQIQNPNSNNSVRQMSGPKKVQIQRPVTKKVKLGYDTKPKASASLKEYYDQSVMPSTVSRSIVMPDRGSTQVTSRHFSRVVSVNADDYPNRNVKIVMDPDLYSPAQLVSAAVNVPAVGTAPIAILGFFQYGAGNTIKSGSENYTATTPTGEKAKFPAWDDGFGHLGFGLTLADNRVVIVMQNTPNNTSKFNICGWDNAGGALDVFTVALTPGASQTLPGALNPATAFISIVPVSGTEGCWVNFSAQFQDVTIQSSGAGNYVGPAFNRQIIDDDISSGRVLGLSILAHNTSNALSLGGNVSAARVPYDFNIFGDVQSDVARLPSNRRYQDSASEGAYVFWVPRTAEEFQVAPIIEKAIQYDKAEFIIINFTGLPAGATFMVQFDWIVEFYSPDQKWEKTMTPPITPAFEAMWYSVLETQAATSNQSHLDLIKEMIGRGKKAVSSVMEHYEDNKDIYNGLARIIGTLLL